MEEMNLDQVPEQSVPENIPAETTEVQETTGVQETAEIETPQAAPAPKLSRMKIVSAIFNGAGIGLLLGVLWSLNTDKVIGGVIATLSSLLALFLGLNEKYIDPLKSMRIGAFGMAAVAGVLFGLYLRINEPFAPTLKDKMNQYLDIGYKEDEARAFITSDIKADSGRVKRQSTLLFSSSVALSECDNLRTIDETYTKDIFDNVLENNYITGTWREFIEEFFKNLDEPVAVKAIITMRACFCPDEGGSGELKLTVTDDIKGLGDRNSVEEIESVLSSSASGKTWQTVVDKVKENFPDLETRKKVYLDVIKVLSHG